MTPMPLLHVHPAIMIAATLAGGAAMIAWRMRETSRPVTLRKIVIPPLGMSTGFAMFALPAARLPWTWAVAALLAGALVLAIPLARASRLVRRGDEIHLERSRAFLWILLGLVAFRLALRGWIEQHVSTVQTGAIFFLLAFGMIARWRIAMLLDYRRLLAPGALPGLR